MSGVIWGKPKYHAGRKRHAYRLDVEADTYQLLSVCGTSWADFKIVVPTDLPDCRTCARLTPEGAS